MYSLRGVNVVLVYIARYSWNVVNVVLVYVQIGTVGEW